MSALGLSATAAGVLGSVTLVAGAAGGLVFGWIADRFGRTRALMLSVIVYSVFTAACGLAQDFRQLLAARVFLGFGMGGEWASGAALVSESWAAEHRGKALGLMQSGWAVGYAAAALVNGLIQPAYGWRAVFFVGILPAFLTIWIRRRVEEPPIWRLAGGRHDRSIRHPPPVRATARASHDRVDLHERLHAVRMVGLLPVAPELSRAACSQGGVGLQLLSSSGFILVMQSGMWVGYVTFGFVSDALGRKPTYVGYLIMAAALLTVFLSTRNAMLLLALGPFVAFFATGYFSGFGAVTAEIYPTAIRATAQGFTYNIGRLASALAPFTVGTLAQTHGFGTALSLSSGAFVLAAVTWIWIPETRGRSLR